MSAFIRAGFAAAIGLGLMLLSVTAQAQSGQAVMKIVKPNYTVPQSAEKADQSKREAIARVAEFPCPDHPDLVQAQVNVSVTFDSTKKIYRYAYTVTNSRRSLQPINSFSIDYVPDTEEVRHPQGWFQFKYGWRNTLRWAPTNPALAHKLKPGQSAGPLVIESPNPPGIVQYYVEGDVDYPSELAERLGEAETEDMEEKCPDYAPAQKFPDGYLTGVTQGPSNAPAPAPTTQLDAAGNIAKITILGSDTFDASAVDFSTIDFWPTKVTASSDRLQSVFNEAQRHKDLVIDVSGLSLNGACNQRDIVIHGKSAGGSDWRAAVPATSRDCIAERQSQKQ